VEARALEPGPAETSRQCVAMAARKKTSPALKRAAKDLRKGGHDAGLAMEERRRIKALEAEVKRLKKNDAAQTKQIAAVAKKVAKPTVARKK
jgi:hypothetical protein